MSHRSLSVAQIAFLRFAHERPKPFAWRWLKADGSISFRPETHTHLAARKHSRGGELRALISVAELEPTRDLWARFLTDLNAAGLRALSAALCGEPLKKQSTEIDRRDPGAMLRQARAHADQRRVGPAKVAKNSKGSDAARSEGVSP